MKGCETAKWTCGKSRHSCIPRHWMNTLHLGDNYSILHFKKNQIANAALTTQHDLLWHTRSKRRHERSKTRDWKSIAPLREMPKKPNLLLIKKKNQEAAFFSYRSKWETNCFLQPGQMDRKNENKPCAYSPRHHLVLCSNRVTALPG